MQIPSVHQDPVLPVQSAELLRMKIQHGPIGPEWTDFGIHLIRKAVQCNIQKTHSQI